MTTTAIDIAIHELQEQRAVGMEMLEVINKSRKFEQICEKGLAILLTCPPEQVEIVLQGICATALAAGYKVGLAKRECEELERMVRV